MKKSNSWIYRGDKKWTSKTQGFLLKAEDRGERQYAHTVGKTNHYTELMSVHLPAWKNWPKRNKAIICTTDFDKAEEYAPIPSYVIPFDKVEFFI